MLGESSHRRRRSGFTGRLPQEASSDPLLGPQPMRFSPRGQNSPSTRAIAVVLCGCMGRKDLDRAAPSELPTLSSTNSLPEKDGRQRQARCAHQRQTSSCSSACLILGDGPNQTARLRMRSSRSIIHCPCIVPHVDGAILADGPNLTLKLSKEKGNVPCFMRVGRLASFL